MPYHWFYAPNLTEPPPAFATDGFLFSEWRHLRQQSAGAIHYVAAVNTETGRAEARCAFWLTGTLAHSPAAASFGSVECSPHLPGAVLTAFVRHVVACARRAGAERLRLTHYPRCYAPDPTDRLATTLAAQAFVTTSDAPTYYVPVDGRDYVATLPPAARRRLAKARRAGLRVAPWPGPATEVAGFIADSRRRQGYPLSLPPDRLARLLTDFPDEFRTFAVFDGNVVANLTVTVRVRPDVLYYFLPADNLVYRPFSPALLLITALYAHCQRERIGLLDLGTALDHAGHTKPGLVRFKTQLGARPSPKYVFEKYL